MSAEIDDIEIRMTSAEKDLFVKHLTNKSTYLEYGCGGSTRLAVRLGLQNIISVDSDIDWINKLKEEPAIAARVANGSLTFEHIDLGPVIEWGVPKDDAKLREWPTYAIRPFRYALEYDFILVDGRFRQSCALAAYAHMLDRTILAIHDYAVRHEYFEVEKFFNLVDSADTLMIFEKKKNVVMQSFYRSVIENLFRC